MILSFVRSISHIRLLIEFNSWMKILKSVPKSVLWLMDYFDLSKANLKIMLNRMVLILIDYFLQRMDISDHLERHKLGDLFLDTFNVNAHTTTSDSPWAGLPF